MSQVCQFWLTKYCGLHGFDEKWQKRKDFTLYILSNLIFDNNMEIMKVILLAASDPRKFDQNLPVEHDDDDK